MTVQIWPVMSNIVMRSTKSQKWDTTIETSGSGRKRSNTNQLLPKWSISVKFWNLTDAEYKTMMGFVALLRGAHKPFYWLDPDDYQETGLQIPNISGRTYQCVMKFGDYVEAVDYVDQLKVYVDGVLKAASTYTVNGGAITFNSALPSGAVVTADYRYYWKVHIPADGISIDHVFYNFKQSGTIKFESWR